MISAIIFDVLQIEYSKNTTKQKLIILGDYGFQMSANSNGYRFQMTNSNTPSNQG